MTFFDTRIPEYITSRKNTIRQLIFTAIFALVFINLYSPFRVDTWYEISEAERFFYSSLVILAGLLIIAISRLIMLARTKKKSLTNGGYILWIAIEIISLAAFYVALEKVVIKSENDIFMAYKNTLKITTLVLLLPYSISYLYFSWLEKKEKLEELQSSGVRVKNDNKLMIPFHDDKGDLRFSLKKDDLLYLEAADNYVFIHYLEDNKKAKYMIRNTLKNFEEKINDKDIIRCHRSYIVNFGKVSIVKKEKDGLVLELDLPGKNTLAISRTYVDSVMKVFSSYSDK